jgi:hypothetical protein
VDDDTKQRLGWTGKERATKQKQRIVLRNVEWRNDLCVQRTRPRSEQKRIGAAMEDGVEGRG